MLRAILDGESLVVHIAGTGSGKSLSFLLPALSPYYHGLTIVILPTVSLQYDLGGRLRDLLIRYAE